MNDNLKIAYTDPSITGKQNMMKTAMSLCEQKDLHLAFDMADMLKKLDRSRAEKILLQVYQLVAATN